MKYSKHLILSSIILLSSCGSENSETEGEARKLLPNLDGAWISNCYLDSDLTYTIDEFIFLDQDVVGKFTSYSDPECDGTSIESGVGSGTFTLGEEITTPTGLKAFEIDITIRGFSSILLDLIYLESDQLKFGKSVSLDNDIRPEDIDHNIILSRQDPNMIEEDDPAQIVATFEARFDNISDLDRWDIKSSSGSAAIDRTTKNSGNGSASFSSTGCYNISMKEGFNVHKGSTYKVSYSILMTDDYVGCVGSFTSFLNQGGEEILYISEYDVPEWETRTYYFKADSDVPVKMTMSIGTSNVWIDDLEIIEYVPTF